MKTMTCIKRLAIVMWLILAVACNDANSGAISDGDAVVGRDCSALCESIYGYEFDSANGCLRTREPEVPLGCFPLDPCGIIQPSFECWLSPDEAVLVWAMHIGEPYVHLAKEGWVDYPCPLAEPGEEIVGEHMPLCE